MGEIHRLVRDSDEQGLRDLVAQASSPRHLVKELDEERQSPLFIALTISNPKLEIVKLLIEAGADVDFVHVQQLPGMMDLLPEAIQKVAKWFGKGNPKEHRTSVLQAAIKHGHVGLVRMLQEAGADVHYRVQGGCTAMTDAIHGPGDRLPIVLYLIDQGVDLDAKTVYGETPVKSASYRSMFSVVHALLKAGADPAPLEWSSLHRSIALGSVEDVRRELSFQPNLKRQDSSQRNAMHLALSKGDLGIAQLLADHGYDLKSDASLVCSAVHSGNLELVRWLAAEGCDLNGWDSYESALQAALNGRDYVMARTLLELGADPGLKASSQFDSPLYDLEDRDAILLLYEFGADLNHLNTVSRRALVGLGEETRSPFEKVTPQEYHRGKFPVEGQQNPEEIKDPFKHAMIRAGVNAYSARDHFKDDSTFSCSLGERQPVFCADRFGQSTTILPDGRIILIAGEHEDGYDPDFCIYNDVMVFEPDASFRLYAYPKSVFPPTDFHTATLVGDQIFIIGNLGYPSQRVEEITVYALHVPTLQISRITTSGDAPLPTLRSSRHSDRRRVDSDRTGRIPAL